MSNEKKYPTKNAYFGINTTTLYGGYLNRVFSDDEEKIRKFPNPYTKRRISITLSKYYGIGVHFHTSISEEDNSIWDPNNREWRHCWDDKEGKGREFFASHDLPEDADEWMKKTIEKEFPDIENYHICINSLLDEDDEIKWFYKEGD